MVGCHLIGNPSQDLSEHWDVVSRARHCHKGRTGWFHLNLLFLILQPAAADITSTKTTTYIHTASDPLPTDPPATDAIPEQTRQSVIPRHGKKLANTRYCTCIELSRQSTK